MSMVLEGKYMHIPIIGYIPHTNKCARVFISSCITYTDIIHITHICVRIYAKRMCTHKLVGKVHVAAATAAVRQQWRRRRGGGR